MKILGQEVEKKENSFKLKASKVNEDKLNILYEQYTRFFGKGQLIYNIMDLKRIITEGFLFNPDVYSIINKKLQTASMVDFQLYVVKDDKSFRQYKSIKRGNDLQETYYYQRKALEPVDNTDINKLLDYPNPYQTSTIFTQNLLGYYNLLGNSYMNKIVVAGNKYGITGEMQVLPAHLVKIVFGGAGNIIDSYCIDNWGDKKYAFPKESIYHFKTFNPNVEQGQFMYGASPSYSAVLTKSNDSYIAATELIRNLGAMGILATGNDDTLNPETTKEMENRYYERFGGASKRGKVWIVGHKMDYINIAQSITDLNLIQGQEQDFLTLCRIQNIDPRIMGYAKYSAFNNMQECKKDFMQNVILPLKYMESEAYNTFILPAFSLRDNKNYYLDVDTKSIPELQVDTDKLSTRIQNEIRTGLITPKDGASILDYPELKQPEANQLYITTNMIPMSKTNEPKI